VSRPLVFGLTQPSEGRKTTLAELGDLTPMGGALQTHTSCFRRLHLTDDALPSQDRVPIIKNSCRPPFKELPAQAGTLGYDLLSDNRR